MPTQEELDQQEILANMSEQSQDKGSDAVMARPEIIKKLVPLWAQTANHEHRMDELAKEQGLVDPEKAPAAVCPSCFAKEPMPHRPKCTIVKPEAAPIIVYANELPPRTHTCDICFARFDKPHRPGCAYFGRP